MPWNDDVGEAVGDEQYPDRGIDGAGQRLADVGSSYGLLWIPDLDAQALEYNQLEATPDGLEPPEDLTENLIGG